MKKRLVSIFITVIMLATVMTLFSLHASASAATAITLTDGTGEQTVLTEDATTATYSYVAETNTLTLNGWSGRKIYANGDFNLHLIGTNTVTMVDGSDSWIRGIEGNVTVTAADGGVLNITDGNVALTKGTYGIDGTVTMVSGTVNIDFETSSSNQSAGLWGYIYLTENTDAAMNIKVKTTCTNFSRLYGVNNGRLYYYALGNAVNAPKFALDIDVDGTEKTEVYGVNLFVNDPNADIDVSIKLDNDSSEDYARYAVERIEGFLVGPGSTLKTSGGLIRTQQNFYQTYFSDCFRSTTPANNGWYFKDFRTGMYNRIFYMCDMEGNKLENVSFAYSAEELPALSWIGNGRFEIPAAKVGDYIFYELTNYVKNSSSWYYNALSPYTGLKFEVVEGAFPAGIILSPNGSIGGTYSAACSAGTVTIKATDRMGNNDASDDRTVTFTVSYGAVAEPDKFITVGASEAVEMRENASGAGWSYDGATQTLTLNNYNGGMITAEKPFNLHLIGTNTVTMVSGSDSWIRGIDGNVTVTAADGGVLNITDGNVALTKGTYGIDGTVTMVTGTVNIDFETSSANQSVGLWGNIYLTENTDAAMNIKVKTTYGGYSRLYGVNNGDLYYYALGNAVNAPKFALDIDVDGTEMTEVYGVDLFVNDPNADIDVSIKLDNDSSENYARYAVERMEGFLVGPGSTLKTRGGLIRTQQNFYQTYFSDRFRSTTPANNGWYFKDFRASVYNRIFYVCDMEGNKLENVSFAYSAEELPALSWIGNGRFEIPAAKVGDYIFYELANYIKNSSSWYYNALSPYTGLKFEVVEGAFPAGIILSPNGSIGGTYSAACPAGTVTVKATDRMGNNDASDDRTVTFTLSYGRVTSNNPVTALTLDKTELILDHEGSGTLTATASPDNAAYPDVKVHNVSGLVTSVGTPENAVSVITVEARGYAGVYTLTVESLDVGLTKTATVYVKEATPELWLDYDARKLFGVFGGRTYRITPAVGEAQTVVAGDYHIDVDEAWLDQEISIVLVNAEEKCNSDAQVLTLEADPVEITIQPVDVRVVEGQTARATFTAKGEGLTYKWYFKNPGATKFSLTNSFKSNSYYVEMLPSRSGRQVYCVVTDKYGNTVQTDTVTLNLMVPLNITSQPQSVKVVSGKTAKVSFTAVGDGLTYKWYFKDVGSSKFSYTSSFKSNSYSVNMSESRNGRQIYCVVSDQYGTSVPTDIVTLSIPEAVTITVQPQNVKVGNAEIANISLTATGEELTYQWYIKDVGSAEFSVDPGYVSYFYSIGMNAERNGRQVYCVVTDKYGFTAQSDTVTLTMADPVKITVQPQSVKVENGKTAKVSFTAVGDGLTYKWYYKNAGAGDFSYTSSYKTNSYSVNMTAARSGRQVYCVVTDQYGNTATTDTVTLSMIQPVVITVQPENVTVADGAKATVSFTAEGEGLTYKWYYKNPGKETFSYTDSFKSNSYSVNMSASRDGRQVYCVVTDQYGNTATTDTVTLSMEVPEPVKITVQPENVAVEDGAKATVSFTAEGEGLTYKWYYKNPGKETFSYTDSFKSNSYSVNMSASRDGRQVYCVVTDQYGNTATTDTVTLSMEVLAEPVKITVQPENVTVADGAKATVSFTAEGEGLTYKWYFKNPGKATFSYTDSYKSNSYSVNMSASRDGRQIYCVVTDQYGNTATTDTVTIGMIKPVTITVQPENVTVANGEKATVSFTAIGEGLTYKWYFKNPGKATFSYTDSYTSNRYYLNMSASKSGRQVYCVVTDQYGNTATTDTVTLSME